MSKKLFRKKSIKRSRKPSSRKRKSIRKSRQKLSSRKRKSIRKRTKKSTRKSLRKMRISRRNNNRKYDGMKKGEEKIETSIKILDEYTENIKLYYYNPFIKTLSFFKLYRNKETGFNSINGKSIEIFITQLFAFNRDINNDNLVFKKQTILGFLIISGMYDIFEPFIFELYKNIRLIDCDNRNLKQFDNNAKKHLTKLNIIKYVQEFIYSIKDEININLYIDYYEYKIKRKRELYKNENDYIKDVNEDVIKAIIFELSKFIFHFICTIEYDVA